MKGMMELDQSQKVSVTFSTSILRQEEEEETFPWPIWL